MDDRQDLSCEKVRPPSNTELDAVAGAGAWPTSGWIGSQTTSIT